MGETELELVHRHERSDVAPRWPVLIGAGMLLLLPIGVAVTALLLNTLWAEPPARPSPFPQETRGTAVPRLQVQPEIELDTLRARSEERRGGKEGRGWGGTQRTRRREESRGAHGRA